MRVPSIFGVSDHHEVSPHLKSAQDNKLSGGEERRGKS